MFYFLRNNNKSRNSKLFNKVVLSKKPIFVFITKSVASPNIFYFILPKNSFSIFQKFIFIQNFKARS